MKRIIAAVLALTVPSCSFVLTTGPGAVGNPPVAYPECTESMTWPIVDGIFAASMILSGIGILGSTRDESDTTEDGGTAGAISAVLMAGAFAAGAYVGYSRVSSCKEKREQFLTANPGGMRGGYGGGYNPQEPPVGTQGGFCTPQNQCGVGLVCAGMPDRTNRCMLAQPAAPAGPAVGTNGGPCTPQLTCNQGFVCAGMPDRTNKCMPLQPTAPAAPAVGTSGGACTAQLTCNPGLVCAGQADKTNKCMPEPTPGTHGGLCMTGNTCNQGFVCAGMPDRSNRCLPAQR
ncbi:MAG: hypothetical protein JNL83_05070 [Myxococcales bacterium]|nr:hypothetical protein [Myxococcales bacterium]